jgi:hypothetical protein
MCAISAAAGRAAADEPGPSTLPITVVTIQTSDVDEHADGLTKALRLAVRSTPGWSLSEGDYSLEVLTLSLKCSDPPDPNCESRIADQIHADRFLWGNIKKKGSNVAGELHFWTRGKGSTRVPVSFSSNLADAGDEMKKIGAEALATLTGGPPKGAVAVHAGKVSGQVFVDGQPIGALSSGEGKFMLASGSRKITVKAPGYADAETSVVVKPVGTSEATLTLTPGEPSQPTDWRRIGGFIALGSGVVFGTIAVVSTIRVAGLRYSDDWKQTLDAVPGTTDDVCDQARNNTLVFNKGANAPLTNSDIVDRCDTAKTFEIVQAIFYPAAAVAGGLGLYLLATSGESSSSTTTGRRTKRPSFAVTPSFGRRAGTLDVRLAW